MIDLTKLTLFSKNNSFKNASNPKGNLVVPASIGAGVIYTNSISFTIASGVDFISTFGYFTSYSDRIFAGPPLNVYRDRWNEVSQIQDVFVYSSSGVLAGQILMTISGNTITITLRISRQGFGAVTITHPTGVIPISLVTYSMSS